jgi:hypothetical protein
MSDELKECNVLKLILIVRFACATLDVGHPINMRHFCTLDVFPSGHVYDPKNDISHVTDVANAENMSLTCPSIHISHEISRRKHEAVNGLYYPKGKSSDVVKGSENGDC